MFALRFLLSLSLVGFAATVAQADGARNKAVALPAPQSSVVVTVERGVRVWRPLGTDGGYGSYPQSASLNSGSEPSVQYVTPNGYGAAGIYGGIGGLSSGKKHERLNGFGVGTKHVNVTIKGWPSRPHKPMTMGHSGGGMKNGTFGRHLGGHAGGMNGGSGPKHVAFAVKGGGGKPRGMGHGRGHH
jgi:hypothetical protein